MTIQLLGFPTTLGLPRVAAIPGAEALRAAGLLHRLDQLGLQVVDHGDMALPPGRVEDSVTERVRKVAAAASEQKAHWLKSQRHGDLLVTIGGDHSTSLGTIWTLTEMGRTFDVIWVDAHGDFNTMETSPTGNPHGMVLAMATGLFPGVLPRMIGPEQLRLWGVRDLDPGERQRLIREKVEVLSPDQVRRDRERIIGRLRPDVFLSFDMDSVDPTEAPGTGVPVPGGFRGQEALELVAAIARQRRLLALDLVEYHPDKDRAGMTGTLALQVIQAALTGRAVGHPGGLAAVGD